MITTKLKYVKEMLLRANMWYEVEEGRKRHPAVGATPRGELRLASAAP